MYTGARANTSTLAMKLKVDAAGSYIPMLNVHGFGDYVHSTTYDFYIIPAKGTETAVGDIALTDAVAKKTINFGAYGTYDEFVALADAPISVAAGEYFLIARSHNGGRGSFCFDGVMFKNCASNQAIRLNLGHDERLYTVKVGEKIQIPFDVDMSNGTKMNVATSSGWSTSADTDAVHVRLNKEESTFDITGKAVTTANETHSLTVGVCTAYFKVKVVPADYEEPDRDLVYDWYKAFTESATFGGDSDYPETVTLGMMTVGSLTEINRWTGTNTHNPDSVKSAPVSIYSDPIGFYQKDDTATGVMAYHNYAMYHGGTGNYDFIIKVPFDGYFLPKVVLTTEARVNDYKAGSQHNVSIMSLDESKTYGTVTISKGAAGTISAASGIKLEKGDYILRFSQGTAGTNFFNGLTLEYMSGLNYDVTLNLNGGTLTEGLASYTHGVAATLPTASKEGYTFAGWYDNAECTGDAVTAIPATARGAKEYFAKFEYVPQEYNVTLNANGGTLASELTSYTEGVGATLPTATKGIATFGGWYDNADFIGDAVTAIGTDATGDKEFWAKWTVEIPETAEITVTSDSGYYSEKFDSTDKEGVIAVSTYFSMFADIKAEVSKVGVMIYVEGNEAVEAKIARVETTDAAKIAEITDTFNALFTAIAEANFGKAVIAKPYLIVSGEYVYGDAVELEGVNAAKWLGPKA